MFHNFFLKTKDSLLKEMKLLGYDEETLKKNIQANKHNDMTTMFLLLCFLIKLCF